MAIRYVIRREKNAQDMLHYGIFTLMFTLKTFNFLSATNNKRLLFELVKSNLTHNNGPFLDTKFCSISSVWVENNILNR